jgi:hypothetical protein
MSRRSERKRRHREDFVRVVPIPVPEMTEAEKARIRELTVERMRMIMRRVGKTNLVYQQLHEAFAGVDRRDARYTAFDGAEWAQHDWVAHPSFVDSFREFVESDPELRRHYARESAATTLPPARPERVTD